MHSVSATVHFPDGIEDAKSAALHAVALPRLAPLLRGSRLPITAPTFSSMSKRAIPRLGCL